MVTPALRSVPNLTSFTGLLTKHTWHSAPGPTTLPSLPDFSEGSAVHSTHAGVASCSIAANVDMRSSSSFSEPGTSCSRMTSKSAMIADSVSHFCVSSAPFCVPS